MKQKRSFFSRRYAIAFVVGTALLAFGWYLLWLRLMDDAVKEYAGDWASGLVFTVSLYYGLFCSPIIGMIVTFILYKIETWKYRKKPRPKLPDQTKLKPRFLSTPPNSPE